MSNKMEQLLQYRRKLAYRGGLLAREWDHFDMLEQELEPAAYRARQDEASRQIALEKARTLSTADLEMILAERKSSFAPQQCQEGNSK